MDQVDNISPVPNDIVQEEKRGQALSFLEEITGRKEMQRQIGSFASIADRLGQLNTLGTDSQPQIDAYLDSLDLTFATSFNRVCDDLPIDGVKICPNEQLGTNTDRIIETLHTLGVDVEHFDLTERGQIGGWFKIRDEKPLIQYTAFTYLIHEVEHFLQWLEVNERLDLMDRKSIFGSVAEHFACLAPFYAMKKFGVNRKMEAGIYQGDYETDSDFLKDQKELGEEIFINMGLITNLPLVLSTKNEIDVH